MPISKIYDIGILRYHIPDIEDLFLRYHRSSQITYDIVGFNTVLYDIIELRHRSLGYDIVENYDIGTYDIVENYYIGGFKVPDDIPGL